MTRPEYLERVADAGSALRYARMSIDMALSELEHLRALEEGREDEAGRFLKDPSLVLDLTAVKRVSDGIKDQFYRATGYLGLPTREFDVDDRERPNDARIQS